MIACLGYGILLIIVIAFMCCLMPWWMVLLIFGVMFLYTFFFSNDALFKIQSRPSKRMKNLERVKKEIEQQKNAESKNGENKTARNTHVSRNNVITGLGTCHQKKDEFDYDRYIAAKREEQAAYDDFIASLDMDDN